MASRLYAVGLFDESLGCGGLGDVFKMLDEISSYSFVVLELRNSWVDIYRDSLVEGRRIPFGCDLTS